MKRIAIIIATLALCGALAGTAQAKPATFVKRGHVAKVEFGAAHRSTTAAVRCPANSSLVSGYVTIVSDPTPYGLTIAAQDVTADEQGWEATVSTLGLYRAGDETATAAFVVNVICIR